MKARYKMAPKKKYILTPNEFNYTAKNLADWKAYKKKKAAAVKKEVANTKVTQVVPKTEYVVPESEVIKLEEARVTLSNKMFKARERLDKALIDYGTEVQVAMFEYADLMADIEAKYIGTKARKIKVPNITKEKSKVLDVAEPSRLVELD